MAGWRVVLVATIALSASAMDHRVIIDGAGRPEHLADLVRRAGGLDGETRNRLITALVRMQAPSAVPMLNELLTHADAAGSDAIIQRLVSFPHGSAAGFLERLIGEGPHALREQALHDIAETWAANLVGHAGLRKRLEAVMADVDHPYRFQAAAGLIRIGLAVERDAAYRVLLDAPDDRLPSNPGRAQMQARLGDPACLPALRAVLEQDFDVVGHNAQVDAAMTIGEAIGAGVVLDREARAVLIATVRDCPHYDPASFAAEALAAEGNRESYDGLMAALATTSASDVTFHALWTIDPERALADCRRLVEKDDPRAFDVLLYGTSYPALIDVYTGLLEQDAASLDDHGRAQWGQALKAVTSLRWPLQSARGDRRARADFLASFFHHADADFARYAMALWTTETGDPLPDGFLPQIRRWLHGDDPDARASAIALMCARRHQFAPELSDLFHVDLPQDLARRVLRACFAGVHGVTAMELVERIGAEPAVIEDGELIREALRHHPEAPALVDELLLDGLLLDERHAETVAHAAALHGDGAVLRCLARHADAGRVDLDVMLGHLADRDRAPEAVAAIQDWLWRQVDDLPQRRDAATLVAVMAAHEIPVADEARARKLLTWGHAALSRWDWSSIFGWVEADAGGLGWFGQLRDDLVTLRRRWGMALDVDEVLDLLLDGGRVERLSACACVQMADPQATAGEQRHELRERLFMLAEHDVPAIRAEALRALAAWVEAEDFDHLLSSCLRDPSTRREAIAAMFRADAGRASDHVIRHHDLIATWWNWFPGDDVRWYWELGTRPCREHAVALCRRSRDAWLAADLYWETGDSRWQNLLLEWRDQVSGPERSYVEAVLTASERKP